MSPTCVNACGKFPSASPDFGSISSANRPTSLAYAAVWDACRKHLFENGISVLQSEEPQQDGKHFLVQRGCGVSREVAAAGFTVVELDTDEFMKSGGSVFCMKMMVD